MKTLIVEDNSTERLLLEERIQSLGHDVTSCANGEEAMEICQQAVYALFILDLGLPGMDGIELCRRIRSLPRGELCMILVITGRDDPENFRQVLEAGADDYVCKPVSLELLKVRLTIIERQLQNLIRRKQAEKALRESVTHIEQAKREWESTVDSLSHVVCMLDRQGHIIRANRTIEHWNLGQVGEVYGLGLHELFHPNCSDAACYLKTFLLKAWEEVNQGRSAECEIADKRLKRYLNIQLQPIASQPQKRNKTDSLAVMIVNDITRRMEIQETLSKQDRLLLGVAGAMNHLLIIPDFRSAITRALQSLGLATDVDRVYIFETHPHPETGEPLMSQRFEWDRFSAEAQINTPEFQNIPYRIGFTRWYDLLSTNNTINGLVRELPPTEQAILAAQNITSILVVPITMHDRFWGFIGFDDCHAERQWRDEEEAVLFAMAGSIGGAIAREQTEEQLRQTSSELRAVFQSLPDEYFRLGADGSILDYKINQRTELLSSDTFIGKWASGLLPADIERQLDTAIEQVHQTKQLVSIEYRFSTSDQKERYEEVRLLPFLGDQIIVVARDITDRKKAEEKLRKRRDHLEELVRSRATELTSLNDQLQQEITKRQLAEEAVRKLHQQ